MQRLNNIRIIMPPKILKWQPAIFILWIFSSVGAFSAEMDSNTEASNREERFMSFFGGSDAECTTSGGMRGICTSSTRCRKIGGQRIGSCRQGASCCDVVANCRVDSACTVTVNGSRIVLGQQMSGDFDIRFPRSKGVDHLHLEFLAGTVLSNPSTATANAGNCILDQLTFSGSPTLSGPFTICGNLENQHMYLAFGNSDAITMSFNKATGSTTNIRVNFLARKFRFVPRDCLQYYTGANNRIVSFGFPNQINNLHYTICFDDRSTGSLTVTNCDGNENNFALLGVYDTNNVGFVMQPLDLLNCWRDWIQLFGQNRYCNYTLPAEGLSTTTRPFMIEVNFDGSERVNGFTVPFTGGACGQVPNNLLNCYVPTCTRIGMTDLCTCQELSAATIIAGNSVDVCRSDFEVNRAEITNRGFCLRAMRT